MNKIKNKNILIPPPYSHKGFTLAETLIALVIVGIVAALTVPSLINKHRKEFVETRLKSAYSILANMFKSAEVDYGTLGSWDFSEFKEQTNDYYAKRDDFISKYMLPYLKISSDKTQSYTEFGYKKIIYPNGNNAFNVSASNRFITLNNGMTFWLNPGAMVLDNSNYVFLTVDIWVDLDGPKKGSNTIAKDIFKFRQPMVKAHPLAMAGENPYSTCSYIANYNYSTSAIDRLYSRCTYLFDSNTGVVIFTGLKQTREQLLTNCALGTHFSEQCGALIKTDSWRIADDYPWL